MKAYLTTYRDALQRILDEKTELNRVSWGAYKNVQGGRSPNLKSNDTGTTFREVFGTDCTLLWEASIEEALKHVVVEVKSAVEQILDGALGPRWVEHDQVDRPRHVGQQIRLNHGDRRRRRPAGSGR